MMCCLKCLHFFWIFSEKFVNLIKSVFEPKFHIPAMCKFGLKADFLKKINFFDEEKLCEIFS